MSKHVAWSKFLPSGCAMAILAFSPLANADLELSGQINRAIVYADDETDSSTSFVDNDNSSSRFRIIGKHKMDSLTFGTQIELELESNASNTVVIGQDSPENDFSLKERKIEFFMDTAAGRIWLGQGDTASNGTSEKDLSGTSMATYSEVQAWGGNMTLRQSNNPGTEEEPNGIKVKDVMSNFDGFSRRDRLRYDTPKFGGLMLSASVMDGEAFDVAAHFDRKFGDNRIKAALAYGDPGDRFGDYDYQLNGSLSFLHSSGFNVTLQAGTREIDDDNDTTDDNPIGYWGKLGYKFGNAAVSLDYGFYEDFLGGNDSSEAQVFGAFFVYKLKPLATEMYVGYRGYMLDDIGNTEYDDINMLIAGARVKF